MSPKKIQPVYNFKDNDFVENGVSKERLRVLLGQTENSLLGLIVEKVYLVNGEIITSDISHLIKKETTFIIP